MALRGYGWRRTRTSDAGGIAEGLARYGFVRVGGVAGREMVFGLVGRFWKLVPDLKRVTPEEFPGFTEEGWAKGAIDFAVSPRAGGTELSTETRVLCFGEVARRRFRFYWNLIEPFSGLIRVDLLRAVRRQALRSTPSPREGRGPG
jgi:hypothetical protein